MKQKINQTLTLISNLSFCSLVYFELKFCIPPPWGIGLSVMLWVECLRKQFLGLRQAYIPNHSPLLCLEPSEKFLVVVVLGGGWWWWLRAIILLSLGPSWTINKHFLLYFSVKNWLNDRLTKWSSYRLTERQTNWLIVSYQVI